MIDLSEKSLIAEDDVRAAPVGATLRIGERALVTPLAADLARERHIRLAFSFESPERCYEGARLIAQAILDARS